MSIRSIDVHTHILPALLQVAAPQQVVYGSDYPYTPVHQIMRMKDDLLHSAELAPYAQDVFFGNASRLYGLDVR